MYFFNIDLSLQNCRAKLPSVARLPNTTEIYTGTWHMRFEIENCHGRFRRIHVTIDRESYLRCLLLFMWYQTWHTNAYVANTQCCTKMFVKIFHNANRNR